MRWVYDFGFFLFAVASIPHFLGKLRLAEDPGKLVRQRFGFLSPELVSRWRGKPCLWIHAVSVGEVLAAEKLTELILERRPELHVVLTTVTPTGQKMAQCWAGERVSVLYFPLDFRFAVSRFFEALRPVALLLMETEIWPNVIQEARRRGIPVLVINGRLSEGSSQGFRRFSVIFKPLLRSIDLFLVQTKKDQERLVALGVDSSKVQVTGNMKLDAFDLNGQAETNRETLREKWGFLSSDLVVIGGSTHAGEEEIIFRVLRRLKEKNLSAKLLLAPRHIERSRKILEGAKRHGFQAALASEREKFSSFEILILDQLGELRKLYAFADAVVMGGSFVRHGGQNPVEPALLSRPIIHGPWVFNFHEIYQRLEEEGGSLRVSGEEELFFVLKRLLASDRERDHLGKRAYEVLKRLRGASERNFGWIVQLIKKEEEVKSEFR